MTDAGLPWGALATAFGALLLLLGTYLTLRKGKSDSKLENTQKSYDQIQEDNTRLREQLAEERANGRTKDAENAALIVAGRLKDNYIDLLRMHINDDGKPPAPPWPKDLT